MESKESFLAAKILVDFIRDFTFLAEQQLLAIRSLMEATVEEIMTSVHNISSTADGHISQASKVMLKDEETDKFREAPVEEVDQKELEQSKSRDEKRIALENQLRRSGGMFAKKMEALSTMDEDVQDVLIKVVGAVSMDDVMGQRLSHVIQSIFLLRSGLARVVKNRTDFSTQKSVKQFRNELLTEVYRSYTAEEEKKIFHNIFGQPKPSHKKVS